jgi:hypothetical protein
MIDIVMKDVSLRTLKVTKEYLTQDKAPDMSKMQKTISKLQKKIDEKADWKFVCSSLDKKAGKILI